MSAKRTKQRVTGQFYQLRRAGLARVFWGKSSEELEVLYPQVLVSLRSQAGGVAEEISGSGYSEEFAWEVEEMICEDLIHSMTLDDYELLLEDPEGLSAARVAVEGWPDRETLCATWAGLVPAGIVSMPTPVTGLMLYALIDEDGEVLEWLVNDESPG
jgi:hypothetical protein